MKVLSLNCQRGYQPRLKDFLHKTLESGEYDFLLLQEFAKEVPNMVRGVGPYKILEAFNDEAGEESQLCIVYRSGYKLQARGFKSFASMRKDPWRGFKHPSFGILHGDFVIEGNAVRLASLHLHSGVDQSARLAELRLAKKTLLQEASIPTMFAGDFNAGYPGESGRMARLLAPEFVWTTKKSEPTLDSRYSENVPHLPNRIAAFFGLFNIRIPLWTDHFFVDTKTAKENNITCRVLPDRVSDHSPVELILNRAK